MIAADRPAARPAALLVVGDRRRTQHLPRAALGGSSSGAATSWSPTTPPRCRPACTAPTARPAPRSRSGSRAGCALARSDPLRRHRLRRRRPPHADRGPRRRRRRSRPATGSRSGRSRRWSSARSAIPRLVVLRFRGRGRAILRRARPARPADPVRPRPRAARALGRLDPGRRRPGRLRAALGRLRARLADARRWRDRGIGFATLTHAAGISSTGDPALDRRLPVRRALPHPRRHRRRDRPRPARQAAA